MKYQISKIFNFSASHILNGLVADHPCSRLHGHNYAVRFWFAADVLNYAGFVIDYRDLDTIKNYINNSLDHRHLNDIFEFNPTSENIAKFLYDTFKLQFAQLIRVEVSETPFTNAFYAEN
ncbi:MAG: 6-carboxytetrahydropterin synthase QueD [Prevotellaceae bacterium]|jgi:6-pyruvoyltetrahydropterin/6-carboxytetrahydropterin synthase|nr:6-carboxytetrahydropterin synthase QueD [Prevotellaceae bacterium]